MRARNRDLLRGLLLVGVLSALLSLIFLLLCTQVFRSATMDFLQTPEGAQAQASSATLRGELTLSWGASFLRIFQKIWFFLLLFLLSSVALFHVLLRRVFGTLMELQDLLERYRAGDLTPRFLATRNDDIGRVGEALSEQARKAVLAKDEALLRQEKKKELFAHIVHDLRTPLSSLDAALQSLSDKRFEANPEAVSQFLLSMEQASNAYKNLGVALPSFQDGLSTSETGVTSAVRGRFDFLSLAKEVLNTFAPLAATQGIQLSLSSEAKDEEVEGNAEQLSRVLRNLLGNAFQYTPSGGSIALSLKNEGNALLCRVSDTGAGISDQDLEHIFLEQYRGEGARPGGAGIGLSFVRKTMEEHGGRAWAESRPGEGSSFVLTFPQGQPSLASRESRTEESARKSSSLENPALGIAPSWLWSSFFSFLVLIAPTRFSGLGIFLAEIVAALLVFFWGLRGLSDTKVLLANTLLSVFIALLLFQDGCLSLVIFSALYGSFLIDSVVRLQSFPHKVFLVLVSLCGIASWATQATHFELSVVFFFGGALTQSLCRKIIWAEQERRVLLTLVTSFALFLLILCSFLLYAVSQEALLPVGSLSATEASALRRSIAHALLPFSLETLFGIITLSALLFRFGERGLKRVFGELSEAATTLHSPHPPSFPRDSEKGDRENPLLNTFALLGEKIRRENESIRRATEETKEIVEATARDIESFVWESEEMLRSLKCLDLSSQEAPALIASARDFLSGEQQLITALFTLVRLQAQSLVPESAERFSPEESLSAALMALGVFARRKGVKVQQSLQAENFLMKGSESTMDALLTAGLQGALVAAGNHGEVEIVATTRGRICLLQMKASVAEKSSLKTPLGFLVARALGSYAAVDCHFEKSASSSALPSGLRAEGQSGSEGAGLPGASRTTSQHLFFEIRAEMPRD